MNGNNCCGIGEISNLERSKGGGPPRRGKHRGEPDHRRHGVSPVAGTDSITGCNYRPQDLPWKNPLL